MLSIFVVVFVVVFDAVDVVFVVVDNFLPFKKKDYAAKRGYLLVYYIMLSIIIKGKALTD